MAPPITCVCGECQKCKRREYMREWYRKPGNAERQRESQLASRARRIEYVQAYDRARGFRETDQEKTKARNATRSLGKGGQHKCERCGAPNAHAHHPDYSKPLEVIWLCRPCHGIEHRTVL